LSSSSSSSSSEDSTTDQSSSSAGFERDRLTAGTGSGRLCCCFATSWLDIRWKGLVSFFSEASGEVTDGVVAAAGCWLMLRKNGFLDCSGGLVTGGASSTGGLRTSGIGGAGGGASVVLVAIGDATELSAGVASGSSSSLSSSSMLSSCRFNSSSLFFAASISALCAASLASFSCASFLAASLAFLSSAFFALPALTLSSSARRLASASSRCC
jgi:hypothetical protein